MLSGAVVLLNIFLICAASEAGRHGRSWQQWKLSHNREYDNSQEETFRRATWEHNMQKINSHNHLYRRGLKSYEMKMNHFGDMDWNEFKKVHFSEPLRQIINVSVRRQKARTTDDDSENFDWRALPHVISPVQNQGLCASSYAFAATSAMESAYMRSWPGPVRLSPQQLIDCSSKKGNKRCRGGTVQNALAYAQSNGVQLDAAYPYVAKNGTCNFDYFEAFARVTQLVEVERGNESHLEQVVRRIGPAAALISADEGFQFYSKGIYTGIDCDPTRLTHSVVVVGFGRENGIAYWTLQNSFGTLWGELGYMRLVKGWNNTCGIASMASVPAVERM